MAHRGKISGSTLFLNCVCDFPHMRENNVNSCVQFIQLHGVEYISLGAVISELTPEERVRDTIEQLTEQTKRLINIGYVVDTKITNAIPLEMWNREYPNDRAMKRPLQKTINYIKDKEFGAAVKELNIAYKQQKKFLNRNSNRLIAGITGHNVAVLYVLSHKPSEALALFREALTLKSNAFGEDHPEVARTLDEIGIQLFAEKQFEEAMKAFSEAQRIRIKQLGHTHPLVSMVLNNIACCCYSAGNYEQALKNFLEARDIQTKTAQDDLDLLHVAITLGNAGYVLIQLKRYEEAREQFEEALLLQQSVLEDGHSAIQNTLSNLEFTNVFHSAQ
mmetsp:Transcript_3737/g.4308  ORF Transcript_3737/g.4308 Transcript_3737/m.4308 type:complete len:333 (+) Transcript_3737:82-1080(+)